MTADLFDQLVDLDAEDGVAVQLALNCVDRGHNGAVIAAEYLADVGEGHIGHAADQINGDVTGGGNVLGAAGTDQIVAAYVVLFENSGEDLIDRHVDRLGTTEQLGNTASCQLH